MAWRPYNVNTTRDGEWPRAPGPHPRPEPRGGHGASTDDEAEAAVTDAEPMAAAASAAASQPTAAPPPAKRPKMHADPTVIFQQGAALQVEIPVLMNIRQVNAGQELRYYQAPKPETKAKDKPKPKAKPPKVDFRKIVAQGVGS